MRSYIFSLLFLVLAATGVRGDATVTAISPSRAINDICIGDQVNYTAVIDLANSGHQVINVSWEDRDDGCNPASGFHQWASGGTSPTISTTESAVGQKTIQVTVTFRDYAKGRTYDVIQQLAVGVNPPDTVFLDPAQYMGVQGVNGVNPSIVLTFKMMRGNATPKRFVYAKGTALEQLTTPMDRPGVLHPFPLGSPWLVGGVDALSLGCQDPGEIFDQKGTNSNFPAGTTQIDYDQKLRIRLPLLCGGTQDFDLAPAFRFKHIVDANGKWHLELVQ